MRQRRALPLVWPTGLRTLTGSNRHFVVTTPVLQPRLRVEDEVPVLPLKLHDLVGLCRAGSVRRGTQSPDLGACGCWAGPPSWQ